MSNIYTVQTGRFKQQRIHGGGDFLKRDSKNNDGSTDEHFDDQFKDDFFFDESNHEETPNETLDDFDDDSGIIMLVLTEGISKMVGPKKQDFWPQSKPLHFVITGNASSSKIGHDVRK